MGHLSKIAYLTGEYPRATDTFIQREVAALRTHGHEVMTYSIRETGVEHLVGDEQRQEAARTFYVLRHAKSLGRLVKSHIGWLGRRSSSYWKGLKLAFQTSPGGLKALAYQMFYFAEAGVLADEMRRQGVTHLHNHIAKSSCTVAMLASEISGIPFSFTLHGPDIFFAPDHWRLDKKIEKARFVACISHFCRSQAMSFSPMEDWRKLHIVHCGVEPERYAGAPAGGKKLLFVGRLAAVKGMPVLLDAMKRLPKDVTLTVIGDGPDRTALEEQAAPFRERVRFLGYQSQTEVAEALKSHDVFVLPSFAEGVPVVLMEAMAAARPVITTRIAGVPELVEDGVSGVLVPPGDVDALSGAISSVSQDVELQQKMGRAGRAKVELDYRAVDEAKWLSDLIESYQRPEKCAALDLRPTEALA
ncbi:glycosyltransferase family 4 protein [Cognatishimia activa]|uniref:Glycosyltransferase family 4 protein n=1 Tax=Cognatishimia activa TaxID=1715691 RepID=A0A975EQ01_9RHOB|nr:glycosyltransferase family 4 protein [Cognatishimia activa]QTN36019.1 glycosyltransferase family 4 protein [Cognatishimia activa]